LRDEDDNQTNNNEQSSITVKLSDKFMLYDEKFNPYKDLCVGWPQYKKQIFFSPQKITVLTDGKCVSSCAQFIKHVGLNHLARIVAVGASTNRNSRFDSGTAVGGAVHDSDYIQSIVPDVQKLVDTSKFPSAFYREGTLLSWTSYEMYGVNKESEDKLLEYYIVDPDVRLEIPMNMRSDVALIGVDDEEIPLIERETQRRNFYINILNEVENVLNKDDIN
ncbi:MAG: hypothetical protein EZS28_054790, partial [Streblomastix strix]